MRTLVTRLAALLLLAPAAFASIATTALTGRVTIGGTGAAEVTVTAASAALQGSRSTITDARGRYRIEALPPGLYDVTFSKPGHTSLTRRAVVELARVARADARLEPSEDEESVTSTASTLTVAETLAVTSHTTGEALQRLPVESTPAGAASLFARAAGEPIELEGVAVPLLAPIGEEITDQVTIVHAAAGAEHASAGRIAATIRRGGEGTTLALRDTISSDGGPRHFFEAVAGGRIVPDKLWFFASGWRGDDGWRDGRDARGVAAKLTSQPGAGHDVEGFILDDVRSASAASLRWTGIFGPHTTLQGLAARATGSSSGMNDDALTLRASHATGSHVVTAGGEWKDAHAFERSAAFVSDRWSAGRWNVEAGARYQEHRFDRELLPRLGVSFDLQGDGRRAFFASWGDFSSDFAGSTITTRIASIGFASAIGTAGVVRLDALRGDDASREFDEVRFAAHYRLFDRFEAGATYSYANLRTELAEPLSCEHVASAWAGAELPLGEHELGFTALQHYRCEARAQSTPSDLAVRYSVPYRRLRVTLASDWTNIFDRRSDLGPRALRFWIRVRFAR